VEPVFGSASAADAAGLRLMRRRLLATGPAAFFETR
jgi:hypothetical protein